MINSLFRLLNPKTKHTVTSSSKAVQYQTMSEETKNLVVIKFHDDSISRSSRPEVFCKRGVLRNLVKFTGKHLRQSLFFNKIAGLRPATLAKKETLTQVLSCEFCEISKNTFSYRTPLVAASIFLASCQVRRTRYQLKLMTL